MSADFDRVGHRYEELVERSIRFCGQEHAFYLEAKARRLLDLIWRTLGDPAGVRALDVGCGGGALHPYLRELGRLEGVDPSEALVDSARAGNPGVEYHVAAGEALPFPEETYDVTTAVAVLHHVEPPRRPLVVRELARVTRPGGLVVVFEHNPMNPLTRLAVSRCEFDEGAVLLGRGETQRLLDEAALEPVESAYILFFPWRASLLDRVERALARVPLGAQYYTASRRSHAGPRR